ncbi:5'-3' exoribonuclease 2 homolog [Chrysoperla carnea]|uniref:5'-3' exoribonuclease 2 homolog n=1 Tax=Chrysoperla carnea TaxID=189513 RepID=UPI001D0886AC|nr:5'-3' exoribonuclease 2 homolog [Chrysoperla carnea]
MGVPAFFRWLSKKYPSVIVHCVEQKGQNINGTKVPIDSSQPNPNGVEFDNLYLDMNGIIHPCTHPEDKPAPKNEDEMMIAIFECIDRLFAIVRPRKLLYMAIDGAAPRAKMNQQRSRRFRASKETAEKIREVERIREELLAKGAILPPEKPKGEHFDSNCITPGTPFMARLSTCLHYYIHDRLNNDPGWHGIKVILSDANVPGEGEHKIMDFIRKQRAQPDHDPNTQHVLCGADADLIMLGLATHEPNFTIIREEFKPNKPRPCDVCGELGHEMKDCEGLNEPVAQPGSALATLNETGMDLGSEGDFIFVRLCVLREYLERELHMYNLPFKYDFERVIDDWVFMCFFVGNDFLPHLPSLEIREGAIDRLVTLYKECVYKTGGYITDSGDVNLDRVQLIMSKLGEAEDEIFKRRQQNEEAFRAREKAKQRRMDRQQQYNSQRPNWNITNNTQFAPTPLGQGASPIQNARQEIYNIRKAGMESLIQQQMRYVSQKAGLGAFLRPEGSGNQNQNQQQQNSQEPRGTKRKHDQVEVEDEQAHDEVRLWEDGFKDRYYESKFDVVPENVEFRYNVALQYVRGLCWVLRYYYQGCASWKWYYPYHYAPFASDFINIGGLSTEFETGTEPFLPLQQLMGVFPAASSAHVPKPWAQLMSDPESTIIDFYPEDFKIDLNGKKFAWQGVALLPFIDEKRLFSALEPYYDQLTDDERRRNVRGDDLLYVSRKNTGYSFIRDLYQKKIGTTEIPIAFENIQGTVLLADENVPEGDNLQSPVTGLSVVCDNAVYCVKFRYPKYPEGFIFPAIRMKGAKEPPRVLKPGDLDEAASKAWRPQIGMAQATQRASLSDSGHRMLGHYGQSRQQDSRGQGGQGGQGQYGAVPPPASLQKSGYSQYRGNNSGGGYYHQNNPNNNRDNNRRGNNDYNNSGGSSGYNSSRNNNYNNRNNDGYHTSGYNSRNSNSSSGGNNGGSNYNSNYNRGQQQQQQYGGNNKYYTNTNRTGNNNQSGGGNNQNSRGGGYQNNRNRR